MHVAVTGAQARLIVLTTDGVSTKAAVDFISQVDPPSQGVPMRQVSIYDGSLSAYMMLLGSVDVNNCVGLCLERTYFGALLESLVAIVIRPVKHIVPMRRL